MSKETLIELINMDQDNLIHWLDHIHTDTFKQILLTGLKEVVQDTKYGCAKAIAYHAYGSSVIQVATASSLCMNHQDNDLEEL